MMVLYLQSRRGYFRLLSRMSRPEVEGSLASDLCLCSLPLPMYKMDSSTSGPEGDATPTLLPQASPGPR